MKSITIITIGAVCLAGVLAGYLVFVFENPDFSQLSSTDMLELIITQRDQAIEQAAREGNYRCCIYPACTMCYMEANQWNNGKAGSCACDDLIAQGKEPCPQCKRGLDGVDSCGFAADSCEVDLEI